jgi:hypothetical protein
LSYEDDLARAKIRRYMYHPEGLVVTDADLAGYRLAVLWLTGAGDSVEAHGPASRFQTTDHAAVSSENALATFSRLLAKRGLAPDIPQVVFNAAAHEANVVHHVDPDGGMTLSLRFSELKVIEAFLDGRRDNYWFYPPVQPETRNAA